MIYLYFRHQTEAALPMKKKTLKTGKKIWMMKISSSFSYTHCDIFNVLTSWFALVFTSFFFAVWKIDLTIENKEFLNSPPYWKETWHIKKKEFFEVQWDRSFFTRNLEINLADCRLTAIRNLLWIHNIIMHTILVYTRGWIVFTILEIQSNILVLKKLRTSTT